MWVIASLAALSSGCRRGPGPSEHGPSEHGRSSAAPTVRIAAPSDSSAPAPAAEIPSSPATSRPEASPRFDADYCGADADCDWDDPCAPSRCQKAGAAPEVKCSESRPAPGQCLCAGNWCSLRPALAPAGGSCTSDSQCAVDVGAGRCVAVDDVQRVLHIGPIDRDGPYCDCLGGRCQLGWADPLPCQSDAECWWERKGGRLKPARPNKPRKLPFRPCHDGEIDAVCRAGSCQVRGWSC